MDTPGKGERVIYDQASTQRLIPDTRAQTCLELIAPVYVPNTSFRKSHSTRSSPQSKPRIRHPRGRALSPKRSRPACILRSLGRPLKYLGDRAKD